MKKKRFSLQISLAVQQWIHTETNYNIDTTECQISNHGKYDYRVSSEYYKSDVTDNCKSKYSAVTAGLANRNKEQQLHIWMSKYSLICNTSEDKQ